MEVPKDQKDQVMKTTSGHVSIDVNLEEVDQIIDNGMRAPLSPSDGEKLKTVVHALVERVRPRWRTTEKTRTVLPQPTDAETTPEQTSPESHREPRGHGRNGAARFTGAHRVTIRRKTLQPGDPCPACGEGKVYRQKQPKTLVRILGRPPLEATRYEMERLRCRYRVQRIANQGAADPGAGPPWRHSPPPAELLEQDCASTGVCATRPFALWSDINRRRLKLRRWPRAGCDRFEERRHLLQLLDAEFGHVAVETDSDVRLVAVPFTTQTAEQPRHERVRIARDRSHQFAALVNGFFNALNGAAPSFILENIRGSMPSLSELPRIFLVGLHPVVMTSSRNAGALASQVDSSTFQE